MFLKKSKTKESDVHELAKICWTINKMSSVRSGCISMRVQGHHPETGGTSVVYYDSDHLRTMDSVKSFFHSILFGLDFPGKEDFISRVNKKVIRGYACELGISGRDADGDHISYDFKSKSQREFIKVIKYGIFQIDNKNHSQYKLIS